MYAGRVKVLNRSLVQIRDWRRQIFAIAGEAKVDNCVSRDSLPCMLGTSCYSLLRPSTVEATPHCDADTRTTYSPWGLRPGRLAPYAIARCALSPAVWWLTGRKPREDGRGPKHLESRERAAGVERCIAADRRCCCCEWPRARLGYSYRSIGSAPFSCWTNGRAWQATSEWRCAR